jgi:hypothetical protein
VRALAEAVEILNAVTSTTNLLHDALMRFRERGVRFVVGGATAPDAETDRVFDEVCEVPHFFPGDLHRPRPTHRQGLGKRAEGSSYRE